MNIPLVNNFRVSEGFNLQIDKIVNLCIAQGNNLQIAKQFADHSRQAGHYVDASSFDNCRTLLDELFNNVE